MIHGYPYCPCRDLTGDPRVDRPNICPCQFHHAEIREDNHCKCVLFVGDNFDAVQAYSPTASSEQISTITSVRDRRVSLYMTSWCFLSRRTKTLLENHGIDYQAIDIDQDLRAAQQVEAWNDGSRSVPTVVVHLVLGEPSIRELESILLTPEITIMHLAAYVTRWCSHSRRTLAWLGQNGIEVEVIDIEKSPEAAERVQGWNHGNLSVPDIEIEARVTEPSSQNLERLLGLVAV